MANGGGVSLWRSRDFQVFLASQTLSALGDSFSFVAIPLLVLQATGSLVQMGVVTGLVGVSSLVTGVFAGYIADRANRRALLIACDVARCVLYGLVPLVWLISPQVWLLYAVVPLAGAFAMQFQVTYVTVVPALVSADQITRANGHLYSSYAVAGVGGPMLAGIISAAFGPTAAVAVDAATFAASAAGLLLIRIRPAAAAPAAPDAEAPAATGRRALLKDFLAGVTFLWRHPVLRSLTVLLSLLLFITTGLTDLIIYYLKHDLGRSDSVVGYVLAAATLGSLLAASTVAPIRDRLGFGACWIGSWALCGVAIAGLGVTTSAIAVGVLATVQLLATGWAGICSMSFRQEVTPDHLLGRVTSAFWTLHNSLGPLGAAALTGAAAHYGVMATCAVGGTACVAIALAALATPIRQRRPQTIEGAGELT
ncbi:MFS transporter [Dactylosporangium sp. NPDC048998]|uniref:MFS transporter n=1 Tax=Dactylosporangium sp. NPDC048998 TaxID=3363976 RepID=UPI00371FA699